jgi:hypothetical protein
MVGNLFLKVRPPKIIYPNLKKILDNEYDIW